MAICQAFLQVEYKKYSRFNIQFCSQSLDDKLYPLQLVLRSILVQNQAAYLDNGGSTFGVADQVLLAESMKYAMIIIASLPVLVLYPFIQKHFVKGVMIGSIKG
ncbi:hypothetical protein EV207_14320 [Scopulibacillus darangshiensis]|uniref:Binding-protein-dependent transport system inner membrane component n=1 Tax=Scopulibacillus darangshiensis TaxID=442528 RepID=A0A4R2NIN1_9BACL|nr:hypothetical protein EV207_14320 [Scopulibacillus darangshiensis]